MATRDRSAASRLPVRSASPHPHRADPGSAAGGRPGRQRADGPDLPRLPEAFHRLYSPPEAPRARARRRTFGAGVAAAVVGVLGLGTAVLLGFGHGGGPQRAAGLRRPSAPPAHAAPLPALATIPNACDVLPAAAVHRFVPAPKPSVDRMGVDTASICTFSSTQGRRYRAIQVDTRGFLPRYLHDQTASMTAWSYEAQWKQAQKDLDTDTSSLQRIGGLGDAAFERYWIDRDVHVAIGETTVRYRNIVLRMRYSEEQPSAAGRAASEQRCLTQAIAAARAGLAAFH